ncbi:MAG: hypothetical protein V4565_08320 [Bacteroidota bacterium]
MRPSKLNKRTLPKRKAKAAAKTSTNSPTTSAKKAKVKVKPKFNLKGIPAKYKLIGNLASEHADTQTQCDELLLVGVSAYETLLENQIPENAEKMKLEVVTKAILIKRASYPSVAD